MIICPNCKKELADGTKFCKFCGTPVTQTNASNPVQSNVPKQATPPAPQKKKSSKKIIIAIVAVLLAAIIALGIIFIPDLLKGKKEDNIEEKLAEVLKESTTKPIVEMVCEDYDNNGTIEAYAIVGETDEEDEEHPEFYDADIYFVNEKEAQPIKENVSGQTNGLIELDETTYISIEVYDEDSDEGKSFIYTADGDDSEESDISGEYSNVHEEDGKVIGFDGNGKKVDINKKDTVKNKTTQPNSEEETTTELPAVDNYEANKALYNEYLINGGLNEVALSYDGDDLKVETCMIDLDDDGTYELLVKTIIYGYESSMSLLAIQDGNVVELMGSYSGGSGGGSWLQIWYDKETSRHVFVQNYFSRNGMQNSQTKITAFSYNGSSLNEYFSFTSICCSPEYEDKYNEITTETSLYVTDENNTIRAYKVNDVYVSETDYNDALTRFSEEPIDNAYVLKAGTPTNPISY